MDYNSDDEKDRELSAEEIQEIEYAFSKFASVLDEENEPQGVISVDNLENLLRSLGVSLTEAEIISVLHEFDPKQTGIISFQTFLLIARKTIEPMSEDDLRLCFAVFDKDVNGHIASQEIRHITFHLGKKYTDDEIDDMMREVDADGDGRISYDDFVYFMTKQ